MKLKDYVIGALLVATMTVGVTSFISTGLSEYGVQNNVNQQELDKLEKIENVTSITTKAKGRASNIESKSNFFNLPGVVKTGKLTFDALKLWDIFVGVIIDVTGLNNAAGNWPMIFLSATMSVSVAFIFVKRWF